MHSGWLEPCGGNLHHRPRPPRHRTCGGYERARQQGTRSRRSRSLRRTLPPLLLHDERAVSQIQQGSMRDQEKCHVDPCRLGATDRTRRGSGCSDPAGAHLKQSASFSIDHRVPPSRGTLDDVHLRLETLHSRAMRKGNRIGMANSLTPPFRWARHDCGLDALTQAVDFRFLAVL